MKNSTSLTRVQDGVSVISEYRALKSSAANGNVKVNLAFAGSELVIHVAGSEQEYQDVKRASAYVARVLEGVLLSKEEIAEKEAMLSEAVAS